MQRVATNELKNGLSHFLDQVVAGEEILITRHGEVVARLIPETQATAEKRRFEAVERLSQLRGELRESGQAMTTAEILALKEEGRR